MTTLAQQIDDFNKATEPTLLDQATDAASETLWTEYFDVVLGKGTWRSWLENVGATPDGYQEAVAEALESARPYLELSLLQEMTARVTAEIESRENAQ